MHECLLCHKTFADRRCLNYHVSKNVCQKPNQKLCPKCLQTFSTKQMCQYHITHNVCQFEQKNKIKLAVKNRYENMSKEELLIKVAQLEGKVEILTEHPQTINNNNQINLIFPKAFGSEQIDHILTKIPNLLHDALTKHTDRSVEYLTEQIHCNKEVFPEYTNVYIRGYKSPFALVSNGIRFQNKPQKRIIDQIIENSISMLQDYVDNNGEKFGQKIIGKYEKYRDLLEENDEHDRKSERRKDLEIEIAGMLLDMRLIIESNPHVKKMLDQLEEGNFINK